MSSQKVENLVVTDAREFTSFDELISALMELHAASDNNPLDRFVSFEMSMEGTKMTRAQGG